MCVLCVSAGARARGTAVPTCLLLLGPRGLVVVDNGTNGTGQCPWCDWFPSTVRRFQNVSNRRQSCGWFSWSGTLWLMRMLLMMVVVRCPLSGIVCGVPRRAGMTEGCIIAAAAASAAAAVGDEMRRGGRRRRRRRSPGGSVLPRAQSPGIVNTKQRRV